MNKRLLLVMAAFCVLLPFAACDEGSGGEGGTGGCHVSDCEPMSDCELYGTGCGGEGGGGGGAISCMECACTYKSFDAPSGCADACDNTISGTPNPNFCNGASALTACGQCILNRCGAAAEDCH